MLHALLIHGTLSAEEIDRVVPLDGRGAILASLLHAGFVNRGPDGYRIRTAAYPSVRSGLTAAGFPVAPL